MKLKNLASSLFFTRFDNLRLLCAGHSSDTITLSTFMNNLLDLAYIDRLQNGGSYD